MVEKLKHYTEHGSVESEPEKNGFARAEWLPFDLTREEIDLGESRKMFSPHRGPKGGVAAGYRCTTYTLDQALEIAPILQRLRTQRDAAHPLLRIRNLQDGRQVLL